MTKKVFANNSLLGKESSRLKADTSPISLNATFNNNQN